MVGVLGTQGVGKSLLLSELRRSGGFSQAFRRDKLEMRHHTRGVDMLASGAAASERLLLLDTEPGLCSSIAVEAAEGEEPLPSGVTNHVDLCATRSQQLAMFLISQHQPPPPAQHRHTKKT